MKYKNVSTLAVTVAALFTAQSTLANEDSNPPIVVTASRLQDQATALPASVTVLTRDDIARSTATTLAELLTRQAGISQRDLFGNSGASTLIDLRGFGAAAGPNTLILLDGRRLNDVDLSAVDLAAIPLANIERIEIVRGAGAVVYGDGAVGGVANIITRQPGRHGTNGAVALHKASYGESGVEARLNTGGGPFSMSLHASGQDSDGYRDNNALERKTVGANLRLGRAAWEVFADLGADVQRMGLPGPRRVDPGAGIDELDTDRRGTGTPEDYADQVGQRATVGIVLLPSEEVEAIVDVGARSKYQESFYDYGGGSGAYTESTLTTASLTPRLRVRVGDGHVSHTVKTGIDVYRSWYNSDRALDPTVIDTPIHQLEIDQLSTAAYVQYLGQISKWVTVNAGGRWQRVTLDGSDDFDPAAPGGALDTGAEPLDVSDSEPMYELGIRTRILDGWSVFANTTRAARFATVDELYEYDPITYARVFSPLAPQISWTHNLGTRVQGRRFSVQPTVYFMTLRDEIQFNPNTFTNDNLDPTRRYGAELSAELKLGDRVGADFNYTYTRAEFTEGLYDGNDVPLVARHRASLALRWTVVHAVDILATHNYVGRKRFDNDQTNTFEYIPAYQTVDLAVAWRHGDWRLKGAIDNVFDAEYFDYGVRSTSSNDVYNAYPLPGRRYGLSGEMSF